MKMLLLKQLNKHKQIEGMIEEKDDIISQTKVKYNKDTNITDFIFPEGVILLSISLNKHNLFLKDYDLVDDNGAPTTTYVYEDYHVVNRNFILSLVGDLSNQTITGIVYIKFSCDYTFPIIKDTYKIFN